MDADNSTTLDHVERFWPCVRARATTSSSARATSPAPHVVIHQPWYKELGGKLGNLIIRSLAVPGIYDTQAGFKALTARCVEDILPRLTIDRWGFDVELLVAARCRGYRVKEVPIVWRNDAASTVPARRYLQVLGEVLRVRRQRAAGRYS